MLRVDLEALTRLPLLLKLTHKGSARNRRVFCCQRKNQRKKAKENKKRKTKNETLKSQKKQKWQNINKLSTETVNMKLVFVGVGEF